jgi:hypothetical protein
MGALSKVLCAVADKIRLIGELNNALAKKSRGCPGWDPTILALQNRLFGTGSSTKGGIYGNRQSDFVPYSSGPSGSYDFSKDEEDRKRIQQGGLNNILLQYIPVSIQGLVPTFNPFYCDHNGLQILPRTMDDNGNIIESSDTARIFIRVNNPHAPWLPVGFNISSQGIMKSDNLVYQGYIEKLWIWVDTPSQDIINQPFLVIALLRSVALFGPGGGSNLYASPSQQQQNTQTVTSPTGATTTVTPTKGTVQKFS